MTEKQICDAYAIAQERFREFGVDTEAAIRRADAIPLSLNCWQGDDVIGFDGSKSLSGGIATTGNYLGRARDFDELTADLTKAFGLIPGRKKLNLHASYAIKTEKEKDRDRYDPDDFQPWLDWAKQAQVALDFNPTFFSHPMMDGHFSLSSADKNKRDFWIRHGQASLKIADAFAKASGEDCVVNFWMPDGFKDRCVDSLRHRQLLMEALDEIFSIDYDRSRVFPAIESKLFGIGAESYTVSSHEFAFAYAISRHLMYCLDAGHFHPTEVISAKISSVLCFVDKILLHVSRPVRWDSDHVVTLDDELQTIMDEILWNDFERRVYLGTDFFDASINRLAAWAVGLRNCRKALLNAALAPLNELREAEASGNYSKRLALLEERKSLPSSAVWDFYCLRAGVPLGMDWFGELERYERDVLALRV